MILSNEEDRPRLHRPTDCTVTCTARFDARCIALHGEILEKKRTQKFQDGCCKFLKLLTGGCWRHTNLSVQLKSADIELHSTAAFLRCLFYSHHLQLRVREVNCMKLIKGTFCGIVDPSGLKSLRSTYTAMSERVSEPNVIMLRCFVS